MKFQDRMTERERAQRGLASMKLVTRVFFPMAAIVAACTPDIGSPESTTSAIVVEFDPSAAVPVVPAPNDLAKSATTGKLVVPSGATATDAQKEFNNDYLGSLTGFPFESTGSVTTSEDLDPATVNAQTVVVIDLAAATPGGVGTPASFNAARVAVTPTFANKTLTIPPPNGAWVRGKQYAVVLIAGVNGLKGPNAKPVIGSQTWALVSAKSPLVACADQAKYTDCKPTVDIIPSTVTDATARLADQTTKAIQLEHIRLGYKPILDAFDASGIHRDAIPIVWTFSIVDAGEVTFDPAHSVIPFPNDAVRTGAVSTTTGQALIKLPNPKTGAELTTADCAAATDTATQLYCGLNTLDGFSTLAPLVSENSDTAPAAIQATLAADSITAATAGLIRLGSPLDATASGLKTAPQFTPCLDCTSSLPAGSKVSTAPQQLQWRLDAPLDERTSYGNYVTTDVKDTAGKNVVANPVFALVRSAASLLTADGHTAVNLITDDQAKALEPLRLGYKPFFDALVTTAGIPRAKIALGAAFTTQSESSILAQLHAYPSLPALAAIVDYPYTVVDDTATLKAVYGSQNPSGAPAVGRIYRGTFITPVAVTGPSGTLDPAHPLPQSVNFVIAFPKTAPTGTTIFGHGITRSRMDVLAIMNTVAATGQAVIATDVLDHGDRSSCTGAKNANPAAPLPSDDYVCQNPTTMKCDEDAVYGLCVLRDPTNRATCTRGGSGDVTCATAGLGKCATDGKCQGATADLLRAGETSGAAQQPTRIYAAPQISGWNEFSLSNFFATRDNFRQQVIDLAKLAQILKSTAATNLKNQIAEATHANGDTAAADVLNAGNINYVGQSLGGILGALYNSVSPDTNNVVLNVPGGRLPNLILDAPVGGSFATSKAGLIAALGAQGIAIGTPAFDTFINSAQWILDEADPANVGWRLTHGVDTGTGVVAPNANRKVFIQFIEGDTTVPNPTNLAFVQGANRTYMATPPGYNCQAPLTCYEFTAAGNGFDATTAVPTTRHGFLLAPPTGTQGIALTTAAQTQVAKFLATGSIQ